MSTALGPRRLFGKGRGGGGGGRLFAFCTCSGVALIRVNTVSTLVSLRRRTKLDSSFYPIGPCY